MSDPKRSEAMDAFLHRAGWSGAARSTLAGDASFRRYERVAHANGAAVLMDAPPPHEDVRPFLDVTARLTVCDVSVPKILAADEAQGFLLIEDLGDALFTRVLRESPAREEELYLAATEALLAIARASRANAGAWSRELKPYDTAVYLREAALFAEWFLPQVTGIDRARRLREEYLALWRDVLAAAQLKRDCLVHRDYHADNLLWLDARNGHHAVGMLDYQDALWGDAAYDLVSLLEDARRDVAPATVELCAGHFRKAGGEGDDFAARYALLGAQRNAKIIGIFTRLTVRDGKPHYLDYLPRVWGHFMHDLTLPLLAPVRQFVDHHVPAAWRGRFVADAAIGGIAA
ncbi:MAG: phosphotransferase [Alphaproteobacteria bacterium]